jgi:hypothetical protein
MNRHRHSRCHYKRNFGSTPAGTNNPPHWRACGATKPQVAHRRPKSSSDNDHSRGEDQQKAVELEVSPRAAPTISSAEKPLPAASAGGGTGSGTEAARAGEPDTRQLPAPRTANALPPDH